MEAKIALKVLCIFPLIFIVVSKMSLAKSVEKPYSASLMNITSTNESACYNFSIGNPAKQEFYSPNYPNEYPKKIQCTRRIIADPGHLVMLDFRDQFHLENSATCEYDKLEVRDGAYGYSPHMGTFCGNEFPRTLVSTKRYMWLQFTSDDNIEYTGFKAVYEFIKMTNQGPNTDDDECAFHKTGPAGLIYKEEISHLWDKYQQDDTLDCMWTIEVDEGKKIYLNWNDYKLTHPNDCDKNFIEIFDEGRTPDKSKHKFCGTTAEPHATKSNITHVRLYTRGKKAFGETNFTLHFTAVRDLGNEKIKQCDPVKEFNCGDQTCVDISVKCDKEYDCKYRYDEDVSICATALGASVILTSEHMIIILVVFFALVIAMCVSISISCYNKIKDRQIREREYKERRSKEASVEATLDRNLRGHSTPDRGLEGGAKRAPPPDPLPHQRFRDEEEESSDGCYVPEVDLSVFKHPNGGETIPKKARASNLQQIPYISESFESLESDVIVPPPPPAGFVIPPHLKERRDLSPPPPSYRIVGGKVIANPTKNDPERVLQESRSTLDSKGSGMGRWPSQDSRPGSARPGTGGYNRPNEKIDTSIRTLDREPTGPIDPKSNFLRGPLEAGAPRSAFTRSPAEIGLPKFGMARVTPDGPRGPLAGKTPVDDKGVPLATFRRPYEPAPYSGGYRPPAARNYAARAAEIDAAKAPSAVDADKDSSRAHSVASTLSAPDVIGKR